MKTAAKWFFGTLLAVVALYGETRLVWMHGFDAGSTVMQCVDFIAVEGAEEGMRSRPCREAADYQSNDPVFRLLRRRGK